MEQKEVKTEEVKTEEKKENITTLELDDYDVREIQRTLVAIKELAQFYSPIITASEETRWAIAKAIKREVDNVKLYLGRPFYNPEDREDK